MKKSLAILLAGLAVLTAGPFRNTAQAAATDVAASTSLQTPAVAAATSTDAATATPASSANDPVSTDVGNSGLTAIAPDWANSVANALAGISPVVAKILAWAACLMVVLRMIFKPVCSFIYRNDPTPSDTEWAQTVAGHPWLNTVAFILDIGASIKITHPGA
jgi:hypothetical protein